MRTVEKLLQPTERTKDSEFGPAYVNPDGPEAAALIEELVEALETARVDILVTLGACRDSMPPDAVEVFQNIAKRCENAAALAKAHHPEEVLK